MRLTGGEGRGRSLHGPGRLPIRPTSDRVREALFDILGARVQGSRFLDVCAGTGAVGIEALSRGASRVVFVERDRRAVALIRRNLERIHPSGAAEVIQADAARSTEAMQASGQTFGVVFLDPPYDIPDLKALFAGAARLVSARGILVLERRASTPLDLDDAVSGVRLFRDYRHGDTALTTFIRGDGVE